MPTCGKHCGSSPAVATQARLGCRHHQRAVRQIHPALLRVSERLDFLSSRTAVERTGEGSSSSFGEEASASYADSDSRCTVPEAAPTRAEDRRLAAASPVVFLIQSSFRTLSIPKAHQWDT